MSYTFNFDLVNNLEINDSIDYQLFDSDRNPVENTETLDAGRSTPINYTSNGNVMYLDINPSDNTVGPGGVTISNLPQGVTYNITWQPTGGCEDRTCAYYQVILTQTAPTSTLSADEPATTVEVGVPQNQGEAS